VRESYALAGHRVEVRSEAALGAEEARAIGAGGVERDEDDVGVGGIYRSCGGFVRDAGGLCRQAQFEGQEDCENPE
jgi:hypothetical protein